MLDPEYETYLDRVADAVAPFLNLEGAYISSYRVNYEPSNAIIVEPVELKIERLSHLDVTP